MELKISPKLSLPIEAVTQTFAILAKRGAGKTYTASVMVEEMLKAKQHVIVIDPIGVWWGLRAGADGKSEGLSIVIAGGDHADIPLQPDSGEVLAEFVVENRTSIVIDLSLFRKGEQIRFMTDFSETLYRKNRNAVHLVLDEADSFAPQRPMPGENRMLGAIEDIVRRGRARGIGVTMITQRPSVLNKNVLTQIEVLVALRLTAPLDQKAIDEWVKTHAEEGQREEFMASLPSLPIGTAWFWSPGWLDLFQRVKVRTRHTLDSSSTPKVGQRVKAAERMAPVDLAALTEKMAATIEQVKSDDPKELKHQIKVLQGQLADQKPQVKEVIKTVEVIPPAVQAKVLAIHKATIALLELTTDALEHVNQDAEMPAGSRVVHIKPGDPVDRGQGLQAKMVIVDEAAWLDDVKLTKAAQTILNVLGQFPSGRTRIQISILSGYSKKSSSFSNALGELRSKGMISAAGQEPITITQLGQTFANDTTPLPTGTALREYWRPKLAKPDNLFLDALMASYPNALTYDQLQQMTGYSRTSSSFSNTLGKLRSLELVSRSNPVKVNEIFFEGETK